jgi:hypothetical protein
MDHRSSMSTTDSVQEPFHYGCSLWFGIGGLLITLLLYWVSHDWHYWEWGENGPAFSHPDLAAQIYRRWITLRVSELGVVLGCLVLVIYGGQKRWHWIVLLGIASVVIAIWVLWFGQPIPKRLR